MGEQGDIHIPVAGHRLTALGHRMAEEQIGISFLINFMQEANRQNA
jgi:hypothetical protein